MNEVRFAAAPVGYTQRTLEICFADAAQVERSGGAVGGIERQTPGIASVNTGILLMPHRFQRINPLQFFHQDFAVAQQQVFGFITRNKENGADKQQSEKGRSSHHKRFL